ncbi:MAG: aminopeptidase [Acidobacteriota bacterium]
MLDPRFDDLAETLIAHSCSVQPGEKVLLEAWDTPPEMARALIRRIDAAGGLPFVELKSNRVHRELLRTGNEALMRSIGEVERARMEAMDAYIGIRGNPNIAELSDVPPGHIQLYQRHWWVPVHREVRVPKTKWVVLRWPDPSMAQLANQSTEAFEDFYFRVCNVDYGKMHVAMQPLIELMERTDRVRVTAPGTDVRFSIKNIPAVGCAGENNIPDGEVFTAPVRDSVEGEVLFNTPTVYQGSSHDDVYLRFERGKIVEARSSNSDALLRTLDADEGARYLGEFAVAFNPHITEPMRDILFDEKIAGSLHITPGSCYDEASNGNKSEIHWDLVLRQMPEVGGGELYFDDRLVRKDGRFVVLELEGLNPERLGA